MDDLAGHADWLGKAWADTVTEDSRPKVEMLIAGASSGQEPRWRHLNHPATAAPTCRSCMPLVRTGTPGPDRRLRPRSARGFIAAAPAGRCPAVDGAGLRPHPSRRNPLPAAVPDGVRRRADRGRCGPQGAGQQSHRAPAVRAKRRNQGALWPLANVFTPGNRPHRSNCCWPACGRRAAPTMCARGCGMATREVVVTASLFRDEGGVACLVRIAQPAGATSVGRRAETEIQAAEADGKRAGRLRRDRRRRPHHHRQRDLPGTRATSHRGAGPRRTARPLARSVRRRSRYLDRQSAPTRFGAAVRQSAARRTGRTGRGGNFRRHGDERRPAVLRLRHTRRRPAAAARTAGRSGRCRARWSI